MNNFITFWSLHKLSYINYIFLHMYVYICIKNVQIVTEIKNNKITWFNQKNSKTNKIENN